MLLSNATRVLAQGQDVSSILSNSVSVWPLGFSPEAGLTQSFATAPGTITDDVQGRSAVIACEVTMPAATGDGALMEKGGSGFGIFVGYRDGGTWFRIRGWNGGSSAVGGTVIRADQTAQLDIPAGQMPQDGAVHTLVIEFRHDVGDTHKTIRFWIDGALLGDSSNPSAGQFGNSAPTTENDLRIEGGADGMYLTGSTQINIDGEPQVNWQAGTVGASSMRVYNSQVVQG